MKVKIRYQWVAVRVKKEEKDYLRQEARERGQRMSDYLRDVLFATATFPVPERK